MMDTKLFRQKILALAIQGKLLPQNPADEPASALLQRIRAEKDTLVKAGKRKADKHPSTITRQEDGRYHETVNGKTTDITDQIPFEIPTSWEWVRLGEISKAINVGIVIQPTRYYTEMAHGIPAFRNCNIRQGMIDDKEWVYLRKEALFENPRSIVHSQDIIIARSGCPGIACLVPNEYDGYCAVDILITSLFTSYVSSSFIEKIINSKNTQNRIAIIHRGVALSHIGVTTIDKLLLPLPPLAEQQRIVSRVEELFAHCDSIDQAGEDWERTASLARQKVLDLAIRGQLLPQNPTDEPASALLQRIRAEKDTLVKAGKRKADKHPSTITRREDGRYHETVNGKTTDITDQIPFEIPTSWEWVRLGEVTTLISGTSYQKGDVLSSGVRILRGGNIADSEIHLHEDDVFLPEQYVDETKNIRKGDVVIVASTGSFQAIGKIGISHRDYQKVQIGAFLRILRISSFVQSYVHLLLKSEYYP